MSTDNFSVQCYVCKNKVDGFSHNIKYILTEDEAFQEIETIVLSCGCAIDFPDWQINVTSGLCRLVDFAGKAYIEFIDVEVINDEVD